MSIPRSQPYRVTWPLTAEQADNIDQMFQLLFDDMRNGSIKISLDEIDKLTFTPETLFHVGDLVYADTTAHLTALPDVTTGNAIISGGVDVAPSWGKIGLTTHVSGILPILNGGTNQSVQDGTATLLGVAFFDGTKITSRSAGLMLIDPLGTGGAAANTLRIGRGLNASSLQLTTSTGSSNVLTCDAGDTLQAVWDAGDVYYGTAAAGGNFHFQRKGVNYISATTVNVVTFPKSAILINGGTNPYIQLNDGTKDAYIQIATGVFDLNANTIGMEFSMSIGGGQRVRVTNSQFKIGAVGTSYSLEFIGKTSGAVDVLVADAAGSWNLTLPITGGTTKWFLQTDGAGVTTWENALRIVANVLTSDVTLNNGAAISTGTLTNAPAAGNPTKWIPVNDNGTTRYIPAW